MRQKVVSSTFGRCLCESTRFIILQCTGIYYRYTIGSLQEAGGGIRYILPVYHRLSARGGGGGIRYILPVYHRLSARGGGGIRYILPVYHRLSARGGGGHQVYTTGIP